MGERTDQEILARIAGLDDKQGDFFGFIRSDLIDYLPFDIAKPFLKDGTPAAEWKPRARSREAVIAELVDYLPFAWEKANDCRGLSAGRSLDHMKAWLWMLGEDDAAASLDDYSLYGKPQLRAISEAVGFDWRAHDERGWRSDEDSPGVPAEKVATISLPFHSSLTPSAA